MPRYDADIMLNGFSLIIISECDYILKWCIYWNDNIPTKT